MRPRRRRSPRRVYSGEPLHRRTMPRATAIGSPPSRDPQPALNGRHGLKVNHNTIVYRYRARYRFTQRRCIVPVHYTRSGIRCQPIRAIRGRPIRALQPSQRSLSEHDLPRGLTRRLLLLVIEPGGIMLSPRRRVTFDSRNEGSKVYRMTWRA